jgi:hypothetical protein
MKTYEELSERLQRASRTVRLPEDPVERLYRRRVANHRRERVTAAIVAMVLFVAAVGGTLLALRAAGSSRNPAPASGEWTPERSLKLEPGQYFYLKGTTYGVGDGSSIVQETWLAPNRSGELRFSTNRPDKYKPYPPEGVYDRGQFPLPDQDDPSKLSTDPEVLEGQLRAWAKRNGISMWRSILNLLAFERSPEALPELRAVLFEVAASLKGITREDGVTDPVGRDAIVLRLGEVARTVNALSTPTRYTMSWELFFDPGTHQLMAEAVGFDADPVPFEILESAIVGARGAAPTDDQLLFPQPVHAFEPPPQPLPTLP